VTKVLYVEHNDDNLYMLKTRLELRGGFEVLAAENSEKGCRLAATEHPDVILMDLEMPDDDRWESRAASQEQSANPGHPNHRHVRACGGERAREGHRYRVR
jgi:CheY-like chemotaxis protein